MVLKGSIYQNNDLSYKEIKDGFDKWKQGKANNDVDIGKQLEQLNRLVKLRDDYNEKRFTAKPSKQVKFKNLPITDGGSSSGGSAGGVRPGGPTLPPTEQQTRASSPVLEGSSELMSAKNSNGQGSSSENSPRGATAGGSSSGASGGSGGSAVFVSTSAIDTAKAKLANAKTLTERIQAQYELSKAIAEHDTAMASAKAEDEKRLLAEQELKRLAELNKEIKL